MKKNLPILSALLLAMGLGGACSCGDDASGARRSALALGLDADTSGGADFLIDFELVAIGDRATREVELTNQGSADLAIELDSLQLPFLHDMPTSGTSLGPGARSKLRISFEPVEETEGPVQQIVELRSNETGGRTYTIRLVGRGLTPRLECEPAAIDFGPILQGTSQTRTTSCTNLLAIPLEVGAGRFRGSWAQWFHAALDGAPDGWVEVGPGEAVELEVRFDAQSLGPNEATLELLDGYGQRIASVDASAEAVANTTVVSPACLDFSYVEVGKSKRDVLELRNIGVADVILSSVELPAGSGASFSVITQGPITLSPDGTPVEVELEFHPQVGGPQQTAVELHLVDGGQPQTIGGCAKGFGGGPALVCDREALDFGAVALGMEGTRRLRCVNGGQPAPGIPLDPLLIEDVSLSDPSFRVAKITNDDGSEGLWGRGYESGEGFEVQVAYQPTAERYDSGELLIRTPGLAEEVRRFPVGGQGRDLPPCDFELRSPSLRFGVVERGASLTLPLAIINHGTSACLIDDLRLGDGSDPAFELEPIEAYELGGLETLRVDVTFSPPEHRPLFEGAITFQISDPADPAQRVELRGSSHAPCLRIEPQVVDFGRVRPGCMTAPIHVAAMNTCSFPLMISSAAIGDLLDAESFQIVRKPQDDWVLVPSQWTEFEVVFSPEEEGSFEGALVVEVAGSEPYVARLLGEGSENPIQTDTFDQSGRPKVDILWVMDNSGSFGPYQERIADNLPAFLDLATEQMIDFRIAVTTSGLHAPPTACPGGAGGGEDGRFFPIDGSSPRILTPFTPNLEQHWRTNIQVGTCHGKEEYLEAALRALSPPLIDEIKSSKHWAQTPFNDGNAGFLRRGASLSIIFVADEIDQSTSYGRTPLQYLSYFRSLKGHGRFKAHAITTAAGGSHCNSQDGGRLLTLVEETDGTWLDICTPTEDREAWEYGLRRMSDGAFSFTSQFVLRGRPSDRNGDMLVDEADIELIIDGKIEPSTTPGGQERWTYDSLTNAINFSPLFIPPPESEITATYEVGCFQP